MSEFAYTRETLLYALKNLTKAIETDNMSETQQQLLFERLLPSPKPDHEVMECLTIGLYIKMMLLMNAESPAPLVEDST
jgi:hypothetical protein